MGGLRCRSGRRGAVPVLDPWQGRATGFKRDPYARELGTHPPFPNCPCLVRGSAGYPWHDEGWRSPAFRDLVIYQLHIGVFWAADFQGRDRRTGYGRFLDVVEKIPYLRDLGINAIQPLPIQEYDGEIGLGYSGLDYFSPEMAYVVEDRAELEQHLATVNRMLASTGKPAVSAANIASGPNQLRCLSAAPCGARSSSPSTAPTWPSATAA
ncbi:hypothetical protein F1643_11300 [Azospirillum sp. INR13]|uniref:hypothetical protein n=1 Tax=Azospirillum sp. INR13 TaxID=2596919 RepID=UPI00189283A8|nr:hypothetical protein [Azospirillum sp. INR13]MBF5094984.1 hypothetical protein [Azospirillum sp. INR13]